MQTEKLIDEVQEETIKALIYDMMTGVLTTATLFTEIDFFNKLPVDFQKEITEKIKTPQQLMKLIRAKIERELMTDLPEIVVYEGFEKITDAQAVQVYVMVDKLMRIKDEICKIVGIPEKIEFEEPVNHDLPPKFLRKLRAEILLGIAKDIQNLRVDEVKRLNDNSMRKAIELVDGLKQILNGKPGQNNEL